MSHILRCEYGLESVKYRLSVGDLSEMKGWSVQKIYLHLRLIGRLGNEGGKIRWDFTLTSCHCITGFLKFDTFGNLIWIKFIQHHSEYSRTKYTNIRCTVTWSICDLLGQDLLRSHKIYWSDLNWHFHFSFDINVI